jgi:hypothetical protein
MVDSSTERERERERAKENGRVWRLYSKDTFFFVTLPRDVKVMQKEREREREATLEMNK